jgi:hypothetical protein
VMGDSEERSHHRGFECVLVEEPSPRRRGDLAVRWWMQFECRVLSARSFAPETSALDDKKQFLVFRF